IYSNPQPDFSTSLPPFSCANSPTPFQNLTQPLTDSNVATWFWQFGDPAGGTTDDESPSYTFGAGGTFQVILTATSDRGCVASTTKPVVISVSPVAGFVVGPACANQPTLFSDTSSGAISRFWQIGASVFTTVNPTYTFASAGSFVASLTEIG